MTANFKSDNVAGAAPEIRDAIVAACDGYAAGYGADEISKRAEVRMREVFEHDSLRVFPTATGSVANALALSVLTPPYGAVLCHREAHVNTDECGAPEQFTNGAKLIPLEGEGAMLASETVTAALERSPPGVVHFVKPSAISITQATEAGRVYKPDHVAALKEAGEARGLRLHMDGARFANAVVSAGASPAEMTWKAGVDILTLGATKNGAMAAEAVILFDPSLADEFAYRHKRAGQLLSKMRLITAQLDAYLTDDLWLRLAAHANAMAAQLANGLEAVPGIRLRDPVEANELFPIFPDALTAALHEEGFEFYPWDGNVVRLVTSFATQSGEVERFIEAVARLSASLRPGDAAAAAE